MNETGVNLLNHLISKGRNVYFSITGEELKEQVQRFIHDKTSISVPFEVESDIETGAFFMEIDFEEISDEDFTTLSESFANPQEFYEFTNEVIRQMFNDDTYIYISEQAEDELLNDENESKAMYCFTICTQVPTDVCTEICAFDN